MLWLALHFPELPLEIFTSGQCDDAGPFVVLQDNRVLLANQTALQQGIQAGATLATAHSIAPTLNHQLRNPEAEQQRLSHLAERLLRFSSLVSVQLPDMILLEIGHSLKLFGEAAGMVRQVCALCQKSHHHAIARLADTPWAAIALARAACDQLSEVPLCRAGMELSGITPKMIERLANMGIHTLGALLGLPSAELGRRFDQHLLKYLSQLQGHLQDPRPAIQPPQRFLRQQHLLQPICDKSALLQGPMQYLADELQAWLIHCQYGCESLIWRFESHQKQQVDVPVSFAQGHQRAADILHITQLQLERSSLPEEVLTVGMEVTRTTAWRIQSRALLPHAAPAHTRTGAMAEAQNTPELDRLLDELNARLGEQICQQVCVQDQHTPEHAHAAVLPAYVKHNPTEPTFPIRPLWLLTSPEATPRSHLELLQGPERIQSQWWQTPTVCRDYYIARHRSGAQCWVYVDVSNCWYIHGYFG